MTSDPTSGLYSTTGRWHVERCTGCGSGLPPGSKVYHWASIPYQPMQPGPEWEAVGDWQKPVSEPGTVCESCLEGLRELAIRHSYGRAIGGSGE